MSPWRLSLCAVFVACLLVSAMPLSAAEQNYKIGVQSGTNSDVYAAENLPNAEVSGYDTLDLAIEALKQGDIGFVLGDLPTLKFYEADDEGLTVVDTFAHQEFGIGVAPGESDLLAAIDVALGEIIDSGEYDDIFAATFGDEIIVLTDDTTGDTATEYPANPTGKLADVLAAGELVFGADMYYPPFESYDDDGNCIGFDCDMAVAIAARIAEHYGQNLTGTMKEKAWDDLLAFQYDDYDASLTAMVKTAMRAEKADFSRSYYTYAQGVLASADSPTIAGVDDLNDVSEEEEQVYDVTAGYYSNETDVVKNSVSVQEGMTVQMKFTVTNNGNGNDAVTLSLENARDWIALGQDTALIGPGQRVTLTVDVGPASAVGDYTFQVTATSADGTTTSTTGDFTVTVTESVPSSGPVTEEEVYDAPFEPEGESDEGGDVYTLPNLGFPMAIVSIGFIAILRRRH